MTHFTDLIPLLTSPNYRTAEDLAMQLSISKETFEQYIECLKDLNIGLTQNLSAQKMPTGYRIEADFDWLNAPVIASHLDSNVRGHLAMLECLMYVDSTNEAALHLPVPAKGQFSAILSELQSAGRGRRGRVWVSPFAANIYLSIVYPLSLSIQNMSVLSPCLALSVVDCLNAQDVPALGVKWPNDIYCMDKKLGGLLLETKVHSDGTCKLVVGLGLNVDMSSLASEIIDQPYTDLVRAKPNWSLSRSELAAQLINCLILSLQKFVMDGAIGIVERWQHWDILKNKNVLLEMPNNQYQGIARGINDTGHLLLEVNDSMQEIVMGEVSVREQA